MKKIDTNFSRRQFLIRSSRAAAAAGAGLPLWFYEERLAAASAQRKPGPNDKPNLALIGCGGQGRYDAKLASKFGNIVAVCDVDSRRADAGANDFKGARTYHDFRKVMERDDVHAIINGTPDHWHTLINLHALRRGKDVYSEKPLTLTIEEGAHLVKVAAKTKGVFQTGSQQRSDPRFRLACELVRNGRIGKLLEVVTSLPAGPRDGPFKPVPLPPELDWDFWQGQTPAQEYIPERCHGTFRYWYDYSGGTMTDWGAHHNDIALWGMGLERSGPLTIEGRPLIEPVPGGYTAASEYRVHYTFPNEIRLTCQSTTGNGPDGSLRGKAKEGEMPHGVKFIGSDGWIFVTRGKIEASHPDWLTVPLGSDALRLYASDNHMGNFFECMRSRKAAICDAEIGHRSVSVCHLGVIAMRVGRPLRWNPKQERFVEDKEANHYLARPMRKPWSYESV